MRNLIFLLILIAPLFSISQENIEKQKNESYMSKIKTKKLNANQVRKMMDSSEVLNYNDNISKEVDFKVYEIGSGEVLVVLDEGEGILYNSMADLKSLLKEVDEAKASHHVLQGFIFSISEINNGYAEKKSIEIISSNLSINDTILLNYSLSSLEFIDSLIPSRLSNELQSALIIYAGLCIIKQSQNAMWFINSTSDDIVEPNLRINNKEYAFYLDILKQVNEDEKVNLQAIVKFYSSL